MACWLIGNADLGNVFLASETEVKFSQVRNPKKQGQGQRRIVSSRTLVIDIRRGYLHVTEFKRKKMRKTPTGDSKSVMGDS